MDRQRFSPLIIFVNNVYLLHRVMLLAPPNLQQRAAKINALYLYNPEFCSTVILRTISL